MTRAMMLTEPANLGGEVAVKRTSPLPLIIKRNYHYSWAFYERGFMEAG